jgi:hypothetical protein
MRKSTPPEDIHEMTNTIVRTYQNASAFSDDAPRMACRGYQVVNNVQESSENGTVIVTYQAVTAETAFPRDAVPSHAGVPPADVIGELVSLVSLALVAAVLSMLVHMLS